MTTYTCELCGKDNPNTHCNECFDIDTPCEQMYQIYSPDGFEIERDKAYTQDEIQPAIERFIERYKAQGYYSTSNRTKIALEDIEDYLTIKEM